MAKSYHELIQLPTFKERFEYLKLGGRVGAATFGSHRAINQMLYRHPEWRSIRNQVIIRDEGCDLAHPDFEIRGQAAFVHHIEPITERDILDRNPKVFDMDNLITTVHLTHEAIHYGNFDMIPNQLTERYPNDTCPWK